MELVSASEAARQLGVHPSQITRGIQQGLITDHAPPSFGRPMINVEEAREARSRGLDRSKQRGPQSPLFVEVRAPQPPASAAPDRATPPAAAGAPAGAAAAAAVSAPLTPPPATAPAPAGGQAPASATESPRDDDDARDASYQASRARRESAAATRAEIELAQLRGKTLDRAEVTDVAFRLGQMLREGMETRRVALAQRLVGLDVPAMIVALADADETHLAALADAIVRDLAPEEARVAV